MVLKTATCRFSGLRIYPGKGIIYVRVDGNQFLFMNQKCKSLFQQRKRPAKIAWTVTYRKQHKKVRATGQPAPPTEMVTAQGEACKSADDSLLDVLIVTLAVAVESLGPCMHPWRGTPGRLCAPQLMLGPRCACRTKRHRLRVRRGGPQRGPRPGLLLASPSRCCPTSFLGDAHLLPALDWWPLFPTGPSRA